MAATQILQPEIQNLGCSGNGADPAPETDTKPEQKQRSRRHRKEVESENKDTTALPISTTPETQSASDDTVAVPNLTEPKVIPVGSPVSGEPLEDSPLQNGSTALLDPDKADSSIENGEDGEERPTVALTPEVIANYAREADVKPFQDQHGNVFAWISVGQGDNKHSECLRIRSSPFRSRLLQVINNRTASTPKMPVVKQAIEYLELEAYRKPKLELANRRVTVGEETFIDMGDDNWRMVRISPRGWTVMHQDQPRFFRPQHMLQLPEPVRGGDLEELFRFVPIESDGERLLLKTWLLGGLYAGIPNPILLIVGQQGSAKTTRSRRLRSLLDPSITPVLGDLEKSNLFLTFQHHAVPCFENVSRFSRLEADMFCRAVTGNGVERRKLYTDGDQVLYSFRRPIIINGLDTPSTRADFLDRCLIISCRRMSKFITLEKLDQQFDVARPKVFGGMLDLLVETLNVLQSTPASEEFRMADFARFGRAVAVALGQKPEDFDSAYRMNIEQQNFEILEDAPMGRVLEKFAIRFASKTPWEGTAEELLVRLREVAHVAGDKDGKDDLPKSPRWLSSRLAELAPAMGSRKVFITKLPRTNAARRWRIATFIQPDPDVEREDLIDYMADTGEVTGEVENDAKQD